MEEGTSGYSGPFDELVGIRVEEASGGRVVATLVIRPELHQPTGILHGGVFTTVIETVASVGASAWLAEGDDRDGYAVGISNHTDFLRAVREGTLRAEASPLQQGRLLQLWVVGVSDAEGRLVARGTVKLVNRRAPSPQP
jgi:1,4-dihydroxy-2-naphthoyl-CoA hydrolase